LITSNVWRRTNILALNQLCERFGRTLEAHPWIVQTDHRKNLSSNLETQIVAPLQILGCFGKGQTVGTNIIHIHGAFSEPQLAGKELKADKEIEMQTRQLGNSDLPAQCRAKVSSAFSRPLH
jgi:hypothetical protein